jgi:kynureninase
LTDIPLATADPGALDAADPLAHFRAGFVEGDPGLVYLDGNSLGRLPRSTAERIADVVRDEWGRELIRGWDHWMDLPLRVGDLLAATVLGARPGEVVVADSTTVNLYRLAAAALDARPDRRAIVVPTDEFPTDRFVLEGLAADRGLELRRLATDPVEGPSVDDVEAVLGPDVALVVLSLVGYRSAAIADLAGISAAARAAGALVLWDLSHAVGSIPIDLTGGGAELAVGCTYKYLNGGPGAPAFQYVRRELQASIRTPIRGWIGARDVFAMAPSWDPGPGIRGTLAGTPSVIALAAVEAGVRLVADAGIGPIRAKGIALTGYAVALHDAWLAPLGCLLGSPRDPARRGAHVSIRHPDAERLTAALIRNGVIPDFRGPDIVRLGLSPLTTSFGDVHRGMAALRDLLAG